MDQSTRDRTQYALTLGVIDSQDDDRMHRYTVEAPIGGLLLLMAIVTVALGLGKDGLALIVAALPASFIYGLNVVVAQARSTADGKLRALELRLRLPERPAETIGSPSGDWIEVKLQAHQQAVRQLEPATDHDDDQPAPAHTANEPDTTA